MTDERAELFWKWALRTLGVIGFIYLLTSHKDVPVAFYVLLGGLLGLPNIIAYQTSLNRMERELKVERKRRQGGSESDDGVDS